MAKKSDSANLVIAISSSALFDLSESDRIFREKGLTAYSKYQIENENVVLNQGDAFHLAQKLLNINKLSKKKIGRNYPAIEKLSRYWAEGFQLN